MESEFRRRFNNPDFLLCDYFDLIGGTSTGSIIAAGLACGMSVEHLKKLSPGSGRTFSSRVLEARVVGAEVQIRTSAGSARRETRGGYNARQRPYPTGLMIMTKRLDTGSPWPLHNHPNARYAGQDGKLQLTQVVRASTAAPTYFEPQDDRHLVARRQTSCSGAFVDGGVSPFNDPVAATPDAGGAGWPWFPLAHRQGQAVC